MSATLNTLGHRRIDFFRFDVKSAAAFTPTGVFVIDDKESMRYAFIPLDSTKQRVTGKLVKRGETS